MIKVECTWGDGPDILVTNEGSHYLLYDEPQMRDDTAHGFSLRGSLDLTVNEAEVLISSLLTAVSQAKDSQRTCRDRDKLRVLQDEAVEYAVLRKRFNLPSVEIKGIPHRKLLDLLGSPYLETLEKDFKKIKESPEVQEVLPEYKEITGGLVTTEKKLAAISEEIEILEDKTEELHEKIVHLREKPEYARLSKKRRKIIKEITDGLAPKSIKARYDIFDAILHSLILRHNRIEKAKEPKRRIKVLEAALRKHKIKIPE